MRRELLTPPQRPEPLAKVERTLASGRLRFQRAGAKTAVIAAYAMSPLKILTPKNHGSAAWAYTGTLGGGLVDGDAIGLSIDVDRAARAFVSTQGPTRVYRSPHGCKSKTHARIGEDGALFLLPDPLACFAGARFRQETEIELAPSASLLFWDILTAGRSAYGERWDLHRYFASLKVSRAGGALIDDALLLDPKHGPLGARLGRFRALATLVFSGPLVAPFALGLRAQIDSGPILPGSRILSAASPLGTDGLLVRFAAQSVEELVFELRHRLDFLPSLLGDNPWARRN